MKIYYTENDFVIKSENETEIINATLDFIGRNIAGTRNKIDKALKKAKKDKKPFFDTELGLDFVWDNARKEYNVIKKAFYEHTNIIHNLFDLITEFFDNSKPLDEKSKRLEYVDKYLDKIAEYEQMDFSKEKTKLKEIIEEMMETLAVYSEQELTEEEAESISDSIDNAFYKPIAEILENIILQVDEKTISVNIDKE